jgi:hypothetical protein
VYRPGCITWPISRRCTTAPAPAVPPPALPDATVISQAIGVAVTAQPGPPHPLAVDGRSAMFSTPDGGRIVIAWIRPEFLDGLRHMLKLLATPVSGIGDEAYRARMGEGLVARVNGHVLMVAPSLPTLDTAQRARVVDAIAHAVVAGATAAP